MSLSLISSPALSAAEVPFMEAEYFDTMQLTCSAAKPLSLTVSSAVKRVIILVREAISLFTFIL